MTMTKREREALARVTFRRAYRSLRRRQGRHEGYRGYCQRPAKGARIHALINHRAEIAAEIERALDGNAYGKVGYIWRATDCDGAHARGECVMEAPGVMEWWRTLDRYARDAEGPESHGLVPWGEIEHPDGHIETRDLALEAFEDGHPYSIRIPA